MRRALLGSVVAIGTLLAMTAVVPAQAAVPAVVADRPGSLTGVVRDPVGRTVSGVVVTVHSADGLRTWSARSGSDGRYRIWGLPASGIGGEWCVDTTGQPKPWAGGCPTLPALQTFGAGAAVTRDVWLRAGRPVSGTVTDSEGAPIKGASVWLARAGGNGSANLARTTTAADGSFSARVPHGTEVRICAAAPTVTTTAAPYGFAEQCTGGVLPGGPSQPLELTPGGAARGRVTSKTGTPVAGVRVAVLPSETLGARLQAVTGADGRWTLRGLASWNRVLEVDAGQVRGAHGTGFVWQVHTDPVTGAQTEIVPQPAAMIDGVDDALAPGAAVSGRVTGPTGAGVAGVSARAGHTTYASEPTRTSVTTRSGAYTVVGVRPGYAPVCFDPTPLSGSAPNLRQGCWKDQPYPDYTALTLKASQTRTGIDQRLAAAAAAAVTVTDDTGRALPGVEVTASGLPYPRATTNRAGVAVLRNITPGQASVGLDTDTVPAEVSETGVLPPLVSFQAAAGTTSRVSLEAASAAAMSGRVLDVDGEPLDLVDVGALFGVTRSDGEGRYLIRGLDASGDPTSSVCFWASRSRGSSSTGYLPMCHDGTTDPYGAARLPIANGEVTHVPDVALRRAGAIAGRLTLPDGSPAAYVGVAVLTPEGLQVGNGGYHSTDPEGGWRVDGIPAGDYIVCFSPNDTYDRKCWEDSPDQQSATRITLAEGEVRDDIDSVLDPLTSVSGTVKDPDGKPVAGVEVSVSANLNTVTVTADDGTWTVPGVGRGSYSVCVKPVGELVGECWKDAVGDETPTPVVVGKVPVTGIDLTPPRGGVVTGRLTTASGAPVTDSGLTIAPVGGGIRDYATPDAQGNFRFAALPPGDYAVCVPAPANDHLPECWDDVANDWQATPIPVTLGQTTSGIDIVLGRPGSIAGTVRLPSGAATSGYLTLSDGTATEGVWTEQDGTFVFPAVRPGSYTLCAQGFDGGTRATCFGETSTHAAVPVVVGSGQARSAVDIRLLAN